jgi:hypothetical protein
MTARTHELANRQCERHAGASQTRFLLVLGDGELWKSKPNDLMTQLSEQRTFRSGELERRLSRLVA